MNKQAPATFPLELEPPTPLPRPVPYRPIPSPLPRLRNEATAPLSNTFIMRENWN
ncbi:MAG TPA: hypothetical protein VGB11_03900 [Candidatus Bathyarchaeia archaeon]